MLAIDEFKLHNGHRYSTRIIDLDTGHILWISHGKKHEVYDFMKHMGHEWMGSVEAVACDMNSDFEDASRRSVPELSLCSTTFYIIKNFNNKVFSAIRKDKERRLYEEGLTEEEQS